MSCTEPQQLAHGFRHEHAEDLTAGLVSGSRPPRSASDRSDSKRGRAPARSMALFSARAVGFVAAFFVGPREAQRLSFQECEQNDAVRDVQPRVGNVASQNVQSLDLFFMPEGPAIRLASAFNIARINSI